MNFQAITEQLRNVLNGAEISDSDFAKLRHSARQTCDQIIEVLGEKASISGPTGPSNSFFNMTLDGAKESLWLSYYGKLAVLLQAEKFDTDMLEKVAQVLSRNGWTLIPDAALHHAIDDAIPEKTWFTEIFSYE
jgi:hypothetical protein